MVPKHGTESQHSVPASPQTSPGLGFRGVVTSHMRLLFLHRSTCSGEMTLPVNGPISVPALIQVLEKMPSPSPGMELWAIITSDGSTRLESFCTSARGENGSERYRGRGEGGNRRRQGPRPTPAQTPGLSLLNAQPGSHKALQGSPGALRRYLGKASRTGRGSGAGKGG